MIPATAARRFWGWRICHIQDNLELTDQKQFQLRDAFIWTAVAAVLCVLLKLIGGLLGPGGMQENAARAVLMVYVGSVVPTVAMMSFLSLVSRLRSGLFWIVIPALAAALTFLALLPLLAEGADGLDRTCLAHVFLVLRCRVRIVAGHTFHDTSGNRVRVWCE